MGAAPSANSLALEPDHMLLHLTRHQVTSFLLLRSGRSLPYLVDKSSLDLPHRNAERDQRHSRQ